MMETRKQVAELYVIFDSGGGVTLQVMDGRLCIFARHYRRPDRACKDAFNVFRMVAIAGTVEILRKWPVHESEAAWTGPTCDDIRGESYRVSIFRNMEELAGGAGLFEGWANVAKWNEAVNILNADR